MTFASYARNFEDVLLWRALNHVGRGFYIDVGAAHPDTGSVTRAFYDRGWHGINVEPAPEQARRFAAARPRDVNLAVALGEHPGRPSPRAAGDETGDEAGDEIGPAVETLAEICRRHVHADIHFLRVGVAGAARPVLAGGDFTAFRPWVVLVEAPARESVSAKPGAAAPGVRVPAEWERELLGAGYRFVWFDGLSRFYLSEERHAALARHFDRPPNLFDDFVRAADTEWARRIHRAEARAEAAEKRLAALERRAQASEERAGTAYVRLAEEAKAHAHAREMLAAARIAHRDAEIAHRDAEAYARRIESAHGETEAHARRVEQEALSVSAAARAAAAEARAALARTEAALAQARAATELVGAMRASTSWRATLPLRSAAILLGRLRGRRGRLVRIEAMPAGRELDPPPEPFAAAEALASPPEPDALPPPMPPADVPPEPAPASHPAADPGGDPRAGDPGAGDPGPGNSKAMEQVAGAAPVRPPSPAHSPPRRVVHQFHSGSAVADAVTNAMFLIRDQLRALGYRSDIFVEHVDPGLADELRPAGELPGHDGYVLLVHHSMGFDAFGRIADLPAPKVLIYHNITPAALLAGNPVQQLYSQIGREQLAQCRPLVAAALADSEYNASELRGLGFDPVRSCTLLFDTDALRRRAAEQAFERLDDVFTLLFVGRIIGSKAQGDLLAAYARFDAAYEGASRLVLVGRYDGASHSYLQELRDCIRENGLDGKVTLTGLVSDDELHGWYASADLYVSLSHHEGFGVPLAEAMAHGVPVLAWPSGGVPYTLGGAGELLTDRAPEAVAARILELARDPARRAAIADRQLGALDRFSLRRQMPVLVGALLRAGAAPPPDARTRAALAANLRVTVTGHVNGSYSLATVNRRLALALEAARPGSVRLVPVETEPTADLSGVPAPERAPIAALAARAKPETGPEIVVSQHYPLLVPADPGDAAMALFFWEESLIPADTVARINASFRALLAPSRFVAKAAVDSGVSIPVRVVGHAPDLARFRRLGEERAGRPRGDEAFTFLHVSSCFPRKGVDALLAAFARAFRRDDPVRLVIKGFPNPHNDIDEQLARLYLDDPDAPDIRFVNRDAGEAEMLALYREADALVLPTRGEGFNIPAAEALAARLPVIVTGVGGHMDFCGPGNARLVDFRFAPSGSHLSTAHSVWADPDPEDLAAALREAVAGRDRVAPPGPDEGSDLAARLDGPALARRLGEAALDVLLRPPPAPLRLALISSWNVRCGVAEYARHLVRALPAAEGLGSVLVLCDRRAASDEAEVGGLVRVRPAWEAGALDAAPALAAAVAEEDPHAVLVQHQPGLLPWGALAALLAAPALSGRVVVVTLHNTRHLADLAESERRGALAALAGASRVLVHTVADLNRMKSFGLTANVTLMPQGAFPVAASPDPRDLPPGSAPLIGCYGFFLPEKGIGPMIGALALLRRQWPDARLRLVNAEHDAAESAAEIAACRDAAEAAGLGDAVEWITGFLPAERSAALLRECDLVVLPYQASKESSSAALRSALSAGVAVAVTPIPLFDEAGDAVLRLPGTGSAALAEGIAGLLADAQSRGRAREAARRWLADRDWDAIGRRTLGMLRGLAAETDSAVRGAAPEPAGEDAAARRCAAEKVALPAGTS